MASRGPPRSRAGALRATQWLLERTGASRATPGASLTPLWLTRRECPIRPGSRWSRPGRPWSDSLHGARACCAPPAVAWPRRHRRHRPSPSPRDANCLPGPMIVLKRRSGRGPSCRDRSEPAGARSARGSPTASARRSPGTALTSTSTASVDDATLSVPISSKGTVALSGPIEATPEGFLWTATSGCRRGPGRPTSSIPAGTPMCPSQSTEDYASRPITPQRGRTLWQVGAPRV
jgi:hypothetical protein